MAARGGGSGGGGALWAAVALATLAGVARAQDHVDWRYPETRGRNPDIVNIRLIRATSTNLYIQAYCYRACTNITWECGSLYHFRRSTCQHNVEDLGNGKYALRKLSYGTVYIVRARMGRGYDEIRARTCSGIPDRLNGLRAGRNGPGWLDIRWTPLVVWCRADVEYRVRYRVDEPGAEFSPWREYGAYPVDASGTLHVGPSHPCDEYPKEFCLLLTEGVRAARSHVVQIQPRLIGGTVGRLNASDFPGAGVGWAGYGPREEDYDAAADGDAVPNAFGRRSAAVGGYADYGFGGYGGFGDFRDIGYGFPSGRLGDEGEVMTVMAYADPDNTLGPSYRPLANPECDSWAGVVLGASVVSFFIIIGGLLNGIYTSYEKTKKLREEAENAENEENEGNEEIEENAETSLTAETRETEDSREGTVTEKREEKDNTATSRPSGVST